MNKTFLIKIQILTYLFIYAYVLMFNFYYFPEHRLIFAILATLILILTYIRIFCQYFDLNNGVTIL